MLLVCNMSIIRGDNMFENVKILDAGFASQIEFHVTEKIDGDPLWTARFLSTSPDAIIQTHLDFLRAGSEYIETCTYQASVSGFMKHMNVTKDEALCLIQKAVELANRAIEEYKKENSDADPKIVGSIGPYGAALHDLSEYTGNYADKISVEELVEWHRPRFEVMMNAGVKIFAFETIPCQKEAEALLSLLSEYPDIKGWFSFSCQDDVSLVHGEKFQDVAVKIYESNPKQILAIGVNCLNPNNVQKLFNDINNGRDEIIPLITYPNSGEKYVSATYEWEGGANCKPLEMFVEDWLKLGVMYIGGCCRTSASNIALIKQKVKELQQKN